MFSLEMPANQGIHATLADHARGPNRRILPTEIPQIPLLWTKEARRGILMVMWPVWPCPTLRQAAQGLRRITGSRREGPPRTLLEMASSEGDPSRVLSGSVRVYVNHFLKEGP